MANKIDPGIINRIVYAKYLFWQGNEVLDKSSPSADGLAVLSYQDAVEMLLRAVAEQLNASIKEQASFDQIIEKIDSAPLNTQNYQIPYRTSLNQLNKARVNFKHFGLLPKTVDVQKFRRDLELVFRDIVFSFFNLNFDEISLVELIKHHRIKNHLKKAEKSLSSNNFGDSILFAAKAYTLLFGYNRSLDLGIDTFTRVEDENIDYVFQMMKRQLEEHQLQIDILKYGIDLADYHYFKSIIPLVQLNAAAMFLVTYIGEYEDKNTFENAQFCLRFVTDSALKIQQYPQLQEGHFFREYRKFEVLKDTDIIVYPDGESVEIIRRAEKGEILSGFHESHDIEGYIAILQDNERAYLAKDAVREIPQDKE
ncbi:MAG: hypothetical protein JSV84_17510 [Gemmatimonadota bacterium]|nr:MAG: hypothetical protein JSV84_17510 [Gemmatimonadota bacterium]